MKWTQPLSNQKCITQPTLINLDPNEFDQELRYYPFAINLQSLTKYLRLTLVFM